MKPKIRTTRYDHKVIDVVDFHTRTVTTEEILDMFEILMSNAIHSVEEGNGPFRIKIDRPHNNDDAEHRAGVIDKNMEKIAHLHSRWADIQRERDLITYERLKKQFEGE